MVWPLVWRSSFDAIVRECRRTGLENYTLRDALKSSNEEIRRLRLALAARSRPPGADA